jgi:hypothetical protein
MPKFVVESIGKSLAEGSPALRDFIGRAASLLDPLNRDLLLQVAKLRAARH